MPKSAAEAGAAQGRIRDEQAHAGTPHDTYFGVQLDAVNLGDGALQVQDQGLDVGGAGLAVIDDEIGMLLGHRGAADAIALKSRAFRSDAPHDRPADW